MQVCTSLQTDNHASNPPLSFYRPDALLASQPRQSTEGNKGYTGNCKSLWVSSKRGGYYRLAINISGVKLFFCKTKPQSSYAPSVPFKIHVVIRLKWWFKWPLMFIQSLFWLRYKVNKNINSDKEQHTKLLVFEVHFTEVCELLRLLDLLCLMGV